MNFLMPEFIWNPWGPWFPGQEPQCLWPPKGTFKKTIQGMNTGPQRRGCSLPLHLNRCPQREQVLPVPPSSWHAHALVYERETLLSPNLAALRGKRWSLGLSQQAAMETWYHWPHPKNSYCHSTETLDICRFGGEIYLLVKWSLLWSE